APRARGARRRRGWARAPASGRVTVGPAESLDVTEIQAERPVWTGCPPPPGPRDCLVQLRAHGQVHPATVIPGDDLRIVLTEPARGVARGPAGGRYHGPTGPGSATRPAPPRPPCPGSPPA